MDNRPPKGPGHCPRSQERTVPPIYRGLGSYPLPGQYGCCIQQMTRLSGSCKHGQPKHKNLFDNGQATWVAPNLTASSRLIPRYWGQLFALLDHFLPLLGNFLPGGTTLHLCVLGSLNAVLIHPIAQPLMTHAQHVRRTALAGDDPIGLPQGRDNALLLIVGLGKRRLLGCNRRY